MMAHKMLTVMIVLAALPAISVPVMPIATLTLSRAGAVTTLPFSCGLTRRQPCLDIFAAAVTAFRVALVIAELPGRA